MPELPEVEVLCRHLAPLLQGHTILQASVRRAKIVRPDTPGAFQEQLQGARFQSVTRRGKYLVFTLELPGQTGVITLLGHLGMTGRMFVQTVGEPLPKHTAVTLLLDNGRFIFEDTRYFGRLTLETKALGALGPEPLSPDFNAMMWAGKLRKNGRSRSRQPIKVRLLDQSLVAGIGNIYASEALHVAGISPKRRANRLDPAEIQTLVRAIRRVLRTAIAGGSTIPLDFAGRGSRDGLFYYGQAADTPDYYEERLRVYDRAGQACPRCGQLIRRMVQASRSTYYCPSCQK